ncbi:MAG: trypsin-like peptidase domain-containing protein, partial [Clostridia bacterium]|nr:trypsin-like peptidase domain-containing protein [Clostridia bacterium]
RISYAPEQVRKQKEKKVKKSGGKGWIAIVAAVCVLLSFGAGFLGAYVAGLTGNVKAAQADTPAESTVIRQVEPSDVSDNDPSAGSGVYADVVGAVADSVVEVYTEYTTTGWFRYIVSGGGSGVIISEDGYIITNNHVVMADDDVTPAESVKVRTRNGDEYPATIIGGDADADIAVIKIEATGLSYATFGDSDKLAVGDEVLAIGNPLGELGGTVTNGIISALAREISVEGNDMTLLQTNTAINPGNSGGGLFNLKGELIGITNAVSDASVEGISFAIPGNEALAMAKQIMEKGPTSSNKTIIGVTLYNIDSAYKASEFGVNSLGVYVYEVKEGYNDDVLRVKDRILAVNGVEVASGDDVIAEIRDHEPGDKIELTLFRDGDVVKVEVTCFESNGDA